MATVSKTAWREQLLAARTRVAADVRAAEACMLRTQMTTIASGASTICAYVPVGAEPGSIEMLDALRDRAARVLLPVVRSTPNGIASPLQWGEYTPGELSRGRWGLLEPPGPWLPESVLAEAGLVFVPALAVDRSGIRLGRGGGFYDRSLTYRDPQAQLVAVVRDAELVDELPSEPHDIRMTHALTPERGLLALPCRE
ncbi:5-formyltetrahydrofolate cyclo-ligase [Mycobacterium sp.]|uniref:5-formyltetrahydrofolate cyclo-ligase n=1 Tax=Mycobacterium sp. TaxID=1785 RepID=UPI003BA8BB90